MLDKQYKFLLMKPLLRPTGHLLTRTGGRPAPCWAQTNSGAMNSPWRSAIARTLQTAVGVRTLNWRAATRWTTSRAPGPAVAGSA